MDIFSRFEELFQWNLQKYSGDFIRITNGDQFFDLDTPELAKKPFGIRTLVSNLWTACLTTYLEKQGVFEVSRMATLEEDKEEGIDLLLTCGFSQFKIRQLAYPDFGAVRWQPCYGLGHPNTEEGRDWKTLKGGKTVYYFSALYDGWGFTKVLRVDSAEFWDKAQQLDKDWAQTPLNADERHWSRPDGAEVVWQKKESNYHKYNFYLPPKLFDTLVEFKIPEVKREALQKFYNKAWRYVKNTYM